MKKILSIVLCICSLISILPVSAYAVDSIYFRDLEWYQSKEEVIKHIVANNWVPNMKALDEGNEVINKLLYSYLLSEAQNSDDEMNNIYKFTRGETNYSTVTFDDENVASLKAETTLYFINPIYNNEIVENSGKARFVCAEYYFYLWGKEKDSHVYRTAYEEYVALKKKLSSIYGAPTTVSFNDEESCWVAEDGSSIFLLFDSYGRFSDKNYSLKLYYLAPNAYEEAKENRDTVAYIKEQEEREKERQTQSTNGL